MVARLQEIMKHEDLSPAKFAEIIGVNRAALSHFISGRNKPSTGVIIKILEAFPYVDPLWLLTGSGSMIKSQPLEAAPTENTLFVDNGNAVNESNTNIDEEEKNSMDERGAKINASPKIEQEHPEKQNSVPEETPLSFSNSSKKVVKVIIYYSDQTFTTLTPDKTPFLF